MEGAAYYYYEIPKNAVNDWLVAENKKRFTEKLIATMEGMSFNSPKGQVTFRKEDHQLLQPMYAFKIKVDPSVAWAIPELTRVISIDEMKIPIKNVRQ